MICVYIYMLRTHVQRSAYTANNHIELPQEGLDDIGWKAAPKLKQMVAFQDIVYKIVCKAFDDCRYNCSWYNIAADIAL